MSSTPSIRDRGTGLSLNRRTSRRHAINVSSFARKASSKTGRCVGRLPGHSAAAITWKKLPETRPRLLPAGAGSAP